MIGLVYYSKFAQSTRNRESMKRVRYQWPASALTDKEMEILYQWRGKTGTPICELLREAVEICDILIRRKQNDPKLHIEHAKQQCLGWEVER